MEKVIRKRIVIDGNSTDAMMYWTDRFAIFFSEVAKKYGFDIASMDTAKSIKRVTKDVDLVFGFAWEQRYHEAMRSAITLDKHIIFILYVHDIHWAYKLRREDTTRLLQRADLILTPYYSYLKKVWGQFMEKTIFFPHFFAPCDRYCNLEYNKEPKMKCLLTGNIKEKRYQIRWIIKEAVLKDKSLKDKVDILQHPRHSTQYWTRSNGGEKEKYPRTLNEYFCAVCDSSVWNLLLTKYVEIPAAGVLLIADEPEDGKKAGFIPWKHYVPITEKNAVSQINDCLKNPEKYEEIRKESMKFVRLNHSVDNRVIQFGDVLKRAIAKRNG